MADDHLRRLERAAQAGGALEREAHNEALRRLDRPNAWVPVMAADGLVYCSKVELEVVTRLACQAFFTQPDFIKKYGPEGNVKEEDIPPC